MSVSQEARRGRGYAGEEEKKETEPDEILIDSFKSIREAMPFNYPVMHYDSLADLINRMSSFDPSLFKRLLEVVLNELPPENEQEVRVFKMYS